MSYYPPIGYIKFRWSNNCDMGGFIYQTGFEQEMYFEADIGKPKYTITEEAVEDKDGNPVFLKRKLDKTYSINLLLRQYQIDAMMFCILHNNRRIYLPDGQSYVIRTMSLSEPSWDQCGAFAEVTIEFTLDPVVSTACCVNETLFPEDTDLGDYIELRYVVGIGEGETHEAVIPLFCKAGAQIFIDWDGYKNSYVAQYGVNIFSHTYNGAGATYEFSIKIYGDIDHIYEVMTNDDSLGTTYGTNENVTDIIIPSGCTDLYRYNLNKAAIINPSDGSSSIDSANLGIKNIEFLYNDFTSLFSLSSFTILEILKGTGNKLTASAVNKILVEINNSNVSTATTKQILLAGGTNAAPDGYSGGYNGLIARTQLESKGWYVETNWNL